MTGNTELDENAIFGRYNRWIVPPLLAVDDVIVQDEFHPSVDELDVPYAIPMPVIETSSKKLGVKTHDYLVDCPFQNLVIGEKYNLEIPADKMLSPPGIEEFRYFISNKIGLTFRYTDVTDMLGLEYDNPDHRIDFNGREEKCGGKFVTRFCRWYYFSTAGYRELSNTFKEELNNVLAPYWIGGTESSQHTFYIDVVDKVDWESGAFGERSKDYEDGSCWWYSGGLYSNESIVSKFCALMPHRALAVRLWLETDEGLRGVGRVWVIRNNYSPIFFNGYGFTTAGWVTHLSRMFNFQNWTKIQLSLDGRYFPNNTVNKGNGIIVNQPKGIGFHDLKFTRKDFHWENTVWWKESNP